jgi:hypothetical protein
MLRRLLVISAAVAAVTIAFVSQPVNAGSCTVLTAEGRGTDQAKASARSLKHLTVKTNRWASRNGSTSVRVAKSSTVCAPKAALVSCIATHKVCG